MKMKPSERLRSNTLNMRIDPKLKYLAELAGREQQTTLTGFIEWAIRRVLTDGKVNKEPRVGATHDPTQPPPPMWGEAFWDIDGADRFFRLATMRSDLLTIPEQTLWKLFIMHA